MGHCQSNFNARCGEKKPASGSSSSNNCFIPLQPILKQKMAAKTSSRELNEIRKVSKVKNDIKIKIKAPVDTTYTTFKWKESPVVVMGDKIEQLPVNKIKFGFFQEKLAWLRAKIQVIRKQNKHGFEIITVDRQNLIETSLNALANVNLFKELRIQFHGDQAEDAGGGLLREWMHLCLQEIMSSKLGIFKQSNTDETAYSMVWGSPSSDQQTIKALNLLGKIMAKAIIQKMSINCPLDYTILRQLCSQPVHLSDIYSYDKQLYKSWVNVIEQQNVEDMCLSGSIIHSISTTESQEIELYPQGKTMIITDQTKEDYIEKMQQFLQHRIHMYCTISIQMELENLFKALTSAIPAEFLTIFEPYEFDMIVNGPSLIDIVDLRNNTKYEGYEQDSEVITWFWEVLRQSKQEQLRNLLHYCTGSMRVPIMGFSKLETTHGHIKKFTIRKIDFTPDNPYPKSHTCFNRLELPEYGSKQELAKNLAFILEEQFIGFGLC